MDGDYILSYYGQILLIFAILMSMHQIIRPEKAGLRFLKDLTTLSQNAPFLFLVFAFIIDASSLKLVTEYGGADLPILYRISAVWGGRAGPLLLFAALISIVT